MVIKLTAGAISDLMRGMKVEKPVLQVLGIKKVPGGQTADAVDRYRLNVSDGVHASSFAMLATQLSYHINNGQLEKMAVISVENYICNVVPPDRRVFIILDLTILASGPKADGVIGDPQQVMPGMFQDASASGNSTYQNTNINVQPQKPRIENSVLCAAVPSRLGSTAENRNVVAIATITPYQNRWTIRAKVMSKTPVKTWSNARGEGKLFSMDLVDESGEIRATAFKEDCDKYFDLFQVNKVYYISRGTLKPANKNFTSIQNDYEMTFNHETVVEPCNDHEGKLPSAKFNFVQIAEIVNLEKDKMIDVIGVVKRASDLQVVIARTTGRELKKRDVFLVDQSGMEVTLTFWGEQADSFDCSSNPVLAAKGVKVSDFGGKSLNTMQSTMVLIDPELKEADVLRKWYAVEGSSCEVNSISKLGSGGFAANWKLLRELKGDNLTDMSKAEYSTVKGVISFMKSDNSMYQACPMVECNKKVMNLDDGKYRCEKCNREFDSFKWRVLLSVSICDFTDNIWVTCFQETAECILGITAEELGVLKQQNDGEFARVFEMATFKEFIFKLRSKMDNFNDESRIRITAASVTPLNYLEYNKKLIEDIGRLVLK